MLLYFNEPEQIDNEFVFAVLELMPDEKKAKLLKSCLSAQKHSATAFALLLFALNKSGFNSPLLFEYSSDGKPYIKNSNLFFNVSHCDTAVACAVAQSEIGVDVQNEARHTPALIKRICTPAEQAVLEGGAPFARLWSQKESILKYRGTGISEIRALYDLSHCSENDRKYTIPDGALITFDIGTAHLSVCCEDEIGEPVRIDYETLAAFVDNTVDGKGVLL